METTRALTKTGGITETGLKWIALVTMLNHSGIMPVKPKK